MKPDEVLRCIDCGGAARYVKVGSSLILLGHIKTPKGVVHPVRLALASRSSAKRTHDAPGGSRVGSWASSPTTGTPERSDSVRAPVEAGSLSRDRTSIPSGRETVHPPAQASDASSPRRSTPARAGGRPL